MLLNKSRPVLIGLAMVLAGCLAVCQSTPPLATSTAPGVSVGITADTCPNVEVSVEQQVTWTNQDTREHVVRNRPAEGNGQFDSGTLRPGDSFAFTFTQPGTYTYECSMDGAMMGTINVQP